MSMFNAGIVVVGWMFSFCLIAIVAVNGAIKSGIPDTPIYVGVTLLVNAVSYAILMHHYLKLKYLVNRFIED